MQSISIYFHLLLPLFFLLSNKIIITVNHS